VIDDAKLAVWKRFADAVTPGDGQAFAVMANHAPEIVPALIAEVERLRTEVQCDGCLGVADSVKGICGCEGTGRLSDMLTTVRRRLADAYQEVERLRSAPAPTANGVTFSETALQEGLKQCEALLATFALLRDENGRLRAWKEGCKATLDKAVRTLDGFGLHDPSRDCAVVASMLRAVLAKVDE
jgi:hypothetical protein